MTTASEWVGRVGDRWAAEWRRTDRSFAALAPVLDRAILAAAPAGGGGRAIDLGCGAGATSLALAAARPDLSIAGVDVSADLVRVAATRAAAIANVAFAVADLNASAAAIAADADLLFSRHGVMFFADPPAVFAALRGAVRPGALLVCSCFRAASLNPWAGSLAQAIGAAPAVPPDGYAPGPFGFADEHRVAALFAAAGWRSAIAEPVDYLYVAGEGDDPVADASSFFTHIGPVASALAAAPDDHARATMHTRLTDELERNRVGERVVFPAAAWIWTAEA